MTSSLKPSTYLPSTPPALPKPRKHEKERSAKAPALQPRNISALPQRGCTQWRTRGNAYGAPQDCLTIVQQTQPPVGISEEEEEEIRTEDHTQYQAAKRRTFEHAKVCGRLVAFRARNWMNEVALYASPLVSEPLKARCALEPHICDELTSTAAQYVAVGLLANALLFSGAGLGGTLPLAQTAGSSIFELAAHHARPAHQPDRRRGRRQTDRQTEERGP